LFYFFKTQILKNPINSISLSAFWAVVCFCQRTDFDDYSLGMAATGPHTSTLVCGKQFQQLEYQAMQISLCFVGFLISAIRGRCQQLTLAQRRSKSRLAHPAHEDLCGALMTFLGKKNSQKPPLPPIPPRPPIPPPCDSNLACVWRAETKDLGHKLAN